MPRPVLGSDPFSANARVPAAAADANAEVLPEAEPEAAPEAAPASPPKSARRSRPKRTRRPVSPTPAPAPAAAGAEIDAKLEALEGRLEERITAQFGSLESKLASALGSLEPVASTTEEAAADDDEPAEWEGDADFVGFPRDQSEPDAGVDADDEADGEGSDDGEDDFVGFLSDAPAGLDEDTGSSSSHSSLDGESDRRGPSFVGGLVDLLTPRGLGRRLGDLGLRGISDEVDEFGKDPVYVERVTQFFDWLYQKYWRVETEGLSNIPDSGRALIVGNHSGTLPFDGVMIATATRLHHPAQRVSRALIEDMLGTLPFLAPFFARVGAVRACQENAERLLRNDELVVVFPEGVKGAGKYYRHRYQLQRFGRGGFIKLCLRTNSPLIPVAVIGSEEIYPIIAKADWIGKPLGLPYTPMTPTFPWLGLLGLVPLPSKWRIRFGEPMSFEDYGPDAIEDDILVNHLKEEVRGRIQEMIDEMLAERNSVWFG